MSQQAFKCVLLSALMTIHLCMRPAIAQPEVHFESLPPEMAISQLPAIAILTDADGFLWIGTWEGIFRYDGYTTSEYLPNGEWKGQKVAGYKITSLCFDKSNYLWIGAHSSGLFQYDPSSNKYTVYKHDTNDPRSLSSNAVMAVLVDKENHLWVGTNDGLNLRVAGTDNFRRFYPLTDRQNSLGSSKIRCLAQTRDGAVWIGTYEGLTRARIQADGQVQFQTFKLTPPGVFYKQKQESPHDFIYTIKEDSQRDGVLWIGTKAGLKRFDTNKVSDKGIESFMAQPGGLSNNSVETLLESTEEGRQVFWIGTYKGLNRFDPAKKQFEVFLPDKNQTNSINDQVVYSLGKDQSGLLWVGTNKGVNKVKVQQKSFYSLQFEHSKDNNIWALAPLPNGDGVWIGTAGSGLKKVTWLQGRTQIQDIKKPVNGHFPQLDFTHDLHIDAQGWLWIATRGSGIIAYPPEHSKEQARQYTDNQGLKDNYIMCMHEDSEGRLWLGAWEGGLAYLDYKTNTIHTIESLPENRMPTLTEYPIVQINSRPLATGKTELWLGTRGGGVLCALVDDRGKLSMLRRYTIAEKDKYSISNDFITDIYFDSQQRVWIATENGVNMLAPHNEKFQVIDTRHGLPSRMSKAVVEDAAGALWVTTANGLSKIVFSQNGQYIIRNFDSTAGLPSNYFNDNLAFRTPDGLLILGTNNGLCWFDPAKIKDIAEPLSVVFTGLKLFNDDVPIGPSQNGRVILNRDINSQETITLNYNDNVFSVAFSALHFSEPLKTKFAYRLIGFNEQWVYTAPGQREATFTNLSEGDYTLEVKAINRDGVWSSKAKTLKIHIRPPALRSPLAYFLYVCALSMFAFWYINVTLSRQELKEKIRLETLKREKTEEIERAKVRFFTHVSHELKTPLTLILSPLEDLIKENITPKEAPEIFQIMHRNASRLYNLINQILILRKTEEGLMKLEVGRNDLIDFVKDICIAFRDLARTHHIQFSLVSSTENLEVWFDREQFEKVMYNLLSNAFKFTQAEGQISVSIDTDGEHAIIVIKDNGKGIGEDELPLVFDPFYTGQADSALEKRQGTGIGLALSGNIVELHGGRIIAQSPGVNQGATFSVILPLGNKHFKSSDIISEQAGGGANAILNSEPAEDSQNLPNEKAEGLTTKDMPLILVVDDNEDIRTYIRSRLKANFQIAEASNGQAGWELTKNILPDLVISDLLMPDMNGLELCKKIKQESLTSHIPVILLSAKGNIYNQIDGLEAGADAYIAKPFDSDLLHARINNLLKTRERLQKNITQGAHIELKELEISHLDELFLQKCIDAIEKDLADPDYSVKQLSQTLFISRMQLYRKIKALTGDTPNHFIRTIRLKRAAQLLEKGYSVAEVTYSVGFQDLKYFRESFRKHFGINPSEYAQNNHQLPSK